jgi:hypothetical protein
LTRDDPKTASSIYQLVLKEFGWASPGQWQTSSRETAEAVRACIEGVARAEYRSKDPAGRARAVELAQAGRAIDVPGGLSLASKAQNMRLASLALLATKTSISRAEGISTEDKQRQLADILDELQGVLEWRQDHLPSSHPDIARALVNVGGTRISLARNTSDVTVRAEIYRAALTEYREAYKLRRAYFGDADDIEDVAFCLHQLGVVGYYLALSDTSASARERLTALGDAASAVARGLQARQRVAWATDEMSANVRDSAAVLGKIALTLATIGIARHGTGKDIDAVVKQAPEEALAAIAQLGQSVQAHH